MESRKAGRPVDRNADGKADRKSNKETKADKKMDSFVRLNFVGLKIRCRPPSRLSSRTPLHPSPTIEDKN